MIPRERPYLVFILFWTQIASCAKGFFFFFCPYQSFCGIPI
ncbi:unnamed protein product [Brugia timori]|uniref:Uncharacterized protein n=1 Tax=Brugia timori TaxID=42155 RepID=A0A0R3Q6Q3_9BILA|nr:unnamed protein product [Brugia timori]